MSALSAPTLPAFDAELLAVAPGTLMHSMLLTRSSTTFSPQLTPDLAAALAPGRPLHSATLRVANTVCDGLRPAARWRCSHPYSRPMWTSRTHGWVLGALGNTGAGLELLELSLQMRYVLLQALYKQVASLLSNVQALRTLRLRATLAIEVAKADESSSHLALWR
ncbi:hypothetical protein EDB83DRAFT_2530668 [Lactarius deliciosus]|nr:hypothetical protein EDB83DRAFT_2530668 [Lactarius deliciosus]